ncbi:uncharacterized protein KGF55_000651 [Candida pseudojiufengensis]|uniref:uncharacterized protein n=1 Tax=Candida pseudojiufengensis TaxID=497109 RepID=UPI0022249345|nr:uncharacterized protein KGF55_000651 [Candida pseudojiufengensis]KAI5966342.1 hypothetical protein KGF55_000651 [Candida pseudojiufengensis]
MPNTHNAPSNEQIKKNLKRDAEDIKLKAQEDASNAAEEGSKKVDELKAKGSETAKKLQKEGSKTAEEAKKAGEEYGEELRKSGKEFVEAVNERGEVIYEAINEKSQEALEAAKKEYNHLEKEGRNVFSQLSASAQKGAQNFGTYLQQTGESISKTSQDLFSRISIELQNPVVISQIFVVAGGLTAGYYGYLERHRIRSDNNVVVGLHASIITGLVLLDGYFVSKYYPQYDKKNLISK